MADIFISYAHTDDKTPSGWVGKLMENLNDNFPSIFLFDKAPTFFIDTEARGNDPLPNYLKSEIDKAKIYLCITSGNYFISKYCLWESLHMSNEAKNKNLNNIIFRLDKHKVDKTALLNSIESRSEIDPNFAKEYISALSDVVNFDTNKTHTENLKEIINDRIKNLRTSIFKRAYPPNNPKTFEKNSDELNSLSRELATDIKQVLDSIKKEKKIDKTKIYLSNLSTETSQVGNKLKSEFKEKFRFIQNDFYEINNPGIDAWKKSIESTCKDCRYAVHIIGKNYLSRIKSHEIHEDTSIQEIEYDTIRKIRSQNRLFHIVWIPKDIEENASKRQIELIQKIRENHHKDYQYAEIIEGDFIDFKNDLKDILNKKITNKVITKVVSPKVNTPIINEVYFLYPYSNEIKAEEFRKEIESAVPNLKLKSVPNNLDEELRFDLDQKYLSLGRYLIAPFGNNSFDNTWSELLERETNKLFGSKSKKEILETEDYRLYLFAKNDDPLFKSIYQYYNISVTL